MNKKFIIVLSVNLIAVFAAGAFLYASLSHKTNQPNKTANKYNRWTYQLTGDVSIDPSIGTYSVDLFETSEDVIKQLKDNDIYVICYFSAGSVEKYRDDIYKIPPQYIGKQLEGWPDENWIDIKNYQSFTDFYAYRLALAVTKRCDAIEPDNVEAYAHNSGFNITYEDQLRFNTWIAEEAHKRGLQIGLKNDLDQIKDLVSIYDFAINEQCFEYNECDKLQPFIDQNKPVYNVEYNLSPNQFCKAANNMNFISIKADLELDSPPIFCTDL